MARQEHGWICLVFVWVMAVCGPSAAGATYYVATCGNNAWTGTSSVCASPNGPKKTIQAGLCLATQDGDTVVVAQGTYTGAGNRDLMFPRSGASTCPPAYNYPGTALAMTLRCETGEDPALCVIDSEGGDVNGNCDSSTLDSQQHRAFYFYQDSASNDSVIEGFTITNGCMYNRQDEPGSKNYGGGIFIYKSQPTIRNCVFTGNRARRGGAIGLEAYEPWDPGWLPVIENCTISNNRAVGGGFGGGIWIEGHIDPLIKDCVVTDNCTTSNGLASCDCSADPLPTCVAGQGGGVWWGQGCDPRIEGTALQDASVIANNAAGEGGGVYIQNLKHVDIDRNIEHPRILRTRVGPNNRARTGSGGGIKVASNYVLNDDNYPLYIENCEIIGNHAENGNGGGLYVYGNGSSIPEIQVIEVTMANVVVAGNTASAYGGGMDLGGKSVLKASNLTFMYNTAGTGGGNAGSAINLNFLDYGQTTSIIGNSILWYDSSPPYQNQIRLESPNSEGYLEIWYGDAQTAAPEGVTYYNTFNQDPLFVDPDGADDIKGTADDDYRLALGSPCIDAGNKWLLPADELDLDNDSDLTEALPCDLGEGARTLGVTSFPNTEVDMGAYEFTGTIQSANPPSGKIDARQPHPTSTNSLEARQGFGRWFDNQYGAPEPIAVTLDPPTSGADEMYFWGFEESGQEMTEQGPLGPNSIYSVTEIANPPGTYEILLDRPISAGYVTTITYNANGDSVFYGCLPGDANADCTSAPADILKIIDYLYGHPTEERLYSPDIDRSGVLGPPDILRVIDLLNGAGTYIPWLNVPLVPNICQPGEEKLAGGGDRLGGEDALLESTPAGEGNAAFIDGFVAYVSTFTLADAEAEEWFKVIAEALTEFSVEHLSVVERKVLAEELQDPSLTFASDVAAEMVPEIVERLLR